MLGVGQQRKCCFNFGKDKLAQDCSSASGTVRNQRFLLVTPDVLIRNHHLWLPVSFRWQRSSIRCRNSFLPIFTLSHYSVLRSSLRKSLRFFIGESESLYTLTSVEEVKTLPLMALCFDAFWRIFFQTNFTRGSDKDQIQPWPTILHSQRAYRRRLSVRLYFCDFIFCVIFCKRNKELAAPKLCVCESHTSKDGYQFIPRRHPEAAWGR